MAALPTYHQFQRPLHPDAWVVPVVQHWFLHEDYPYHLHRSPLLQPLPLVLAHNTELLPAGQSCDDPATERNCSNTEEAARTGETKRSLDHHAEP